MLCGILKNSEPFTSDNCISKTRNCKASVTLCGSCTLKENIGNIHYGWIGRAIGFSRGELLFAASVYQKGGPDEPHDIVAINIGMDLWDKGGELCSLIKIHENALKADGARDLSNCEPCNCEYK